VTSSTLIAGAVDSSATDSIRGELVAERGDDQPLFNLGGRLEDIRARCEEETRLPAPVKPTFVKAG